jgi:EmrB/QacA subfamily drug resistance transporter
MANQKSNSILWVLFMGVLMGALDIAIVGPALPAIRAQYLVSERLLAWIFSIYVLFNLIGTPVMAKLSDLYGRRSIYVLDVALFAVGSLIVSLSPSFSFVLLGRGIQGFGAGGIFPVASAVIGDTFPPEKRGSALGLIGAVFGLAFIIGPILGGVLLMAGWKWLFIINLPIAALVIAFSLRYLPGARPNKPASFDWAGMLMVSVMLGALAYGINQIDTAAFFTSLISTRVFPFLIIAIVFGAGLVVVEKRSNSPILPPALFQRRQLTLTYFLSAGAGLGESSLVFMPLLAVAAFNMKSSTASFMLMPVVIAMGFGSPLVGRLLDRLGSRLVILAGTAIMAVGMLMLSQLAGQLAFFILAGFLIGLGLSALLGAPMRYIMLNESTSSERSIAQGVQSLFTSIGQLLGSAAVGAVAASRGGGLAGYGSAFAMIGILGIILLVTAFGLKNHSTEIATAQANEASQPFQAQQPQM